MCNYIGGGPQIYSYPPANGTLNMVPGRYLKFVILNPQYPIDNSECLWGRGKLSEVYGIGY